MKRRGGWHSSWCGTNSCQPGVLEALRPIFALNEPILLAGGSVLQAALGVRWNKKKLSDIDVFVHAKDAADATRISSAIFAAFNLNDEKLRAVEEKLRAVEVSKKNLQDTEQAVNRLNEKGSRAGCKNDQNVCVCKECKQKRKLQPKLQADLDEKKKVHQKLTQEAPPVQNGFKVREVKRAAHAINIAVEHVGADPNMSRSTYDGCTALWQDVQLILRLYTSPAEVLLGFDVHSCCIGYDGRNVWALPRCLRALQHQVNVVNALHAWPNRASYEFRLVKYASRGFGICVPGLDRLNVDSDKIRRTPLEELKGMGRLLHIAHQTEFSLLGMEEFKKRHEKR